MAYGDGQTMSKTSTNNLQEVLQAQDGIVYRQMWEYVALVKFRLSMYLPSRKRRHAEGLNWLKLG